MLASNKPTVTIGMPIYNGEKYVEETITSLLSQSYQSFQLLISDNASTDRTNKVCQKFASKDPRIIYFRQRKNIGAVNNFKYVLARVKTDFFMWAACDDLWDKNFLSDCYELIHLNSDMVLVFPNFVNINSKGDTIRTYDPQKFISRGSCTDAINYMKLYGADGKANLFYGLWRTKALKGKPIREFWANDISYIYAATLGYKIGYVNKVLFKKRIVEISPPGNTTYFSLSAKLKHVAKPITKRIHLLINSSQYFYYLIYDTIINKNISLGNKIEVLVWTPLIIIRTIYTCRL